MLCKTCKAFECDTIAEMRRHYIEAHPDKPSRRKKAPTVPITGTPQGEGATPPVSELVREVQETDRDYEEILKADTRLAMREMTLARIERRTKELRGELPTKEEQAQNDPIKWIKAFTEIQDKATDRTLDIQEEVKAQLQNANVPEEQQKQIGGTLDTILNNPTLLNTLIETFAPQIGTFLSPSK